MNEDIDRTTKDIGKVKLIGAPENDRRKPSKTLVNSRSVSKLMRHSVTIPRNPNSPPLSPLMVNGVFSAPSTPNPSGTPSSPTTSPPVSPPVSPPSSPPATPTGPLPTSFSTPNPRSTGAPSLVASPSSPTPPAQTTFIPATPTNAPTTPTAKVTPQPTPSPVSPSQPTLQTQPQPPTQPKPAPTISVPVTLTPQPAQQPTPVTPNSQSAQHAKLLETKEAILKQLQALDIQPLEKKAPPQQPPTEPPKEEKETTDENATTAAEGDRPKRKPKRDVGTIRKMNEHQFRETVRAQLESELEAIEAQIAVAQGTERPAQAHGTLRRLTPPREAPASAGTHTPTPHGTLRRLTPPREAPPSTDAPAMRVSLQPAKPIMKREDSLPEALKALKKIKNTGRESTLLEASSAPTSPAPMPIPTSPTAEEDHKSNMRDLRASTSYLPHTPQALSSSPTPQSTVPTSAAPATITPSSFSLPPSEKDDVLGYGKMTHGGIRKHVAMLDRTKLEAYLTEEEFQRVFSMNRTEFATIPKWKQERCKRERGLL